MLLERFKKQQEIYQQKALEELKNELKESHWMWFIFPQISGLGSSEMATYYAIDSFEELQMYIADKELMKNYLMLCDVLISTRKTDPKEIFGYTDSLKLKSSLTLFYLATKNVTMKVLLNKFFDGELDSYTLGKYSYWDELYTNEMLKDIYISDTDLNTIKELNMLEDLKAMVRKNNIINLCTTDLRYVFSGNEIIGYFVVENDETNIVTLKEKAAKNVLVYIHNSVVGLKQVENIMKEIDKTFSGNHSSLIGIGHGGVRRIVGIITG